MKKKGSTFGSIKTLCEGQELTLNAFKNQILQLQPTEGNWFEIIIPKQMLQRLSIALAQVKESNTSENVLNKICQIVYSLNRAKEIAKKVYNNITNSINW